MKSLYLLSPLLFLLAAVLNNGCTDNAPSGPTASLGNVAVTKYVAIGNSLTAGFQSNALFESGQRYSFPALLAQQLTTCGANLGRFEMPIISDPGNADPVTGRAARYEIISLSGPDPVVGPRGLAPGVPTNLSLARPYDDLGIPGAVIYDFLDTTDFATKSIARDNAFFELVLRNAALGNSILAQARALNPDLVTFWLGNNDVLGFATSGGVSPAAPTNAGVFAFLYSHALDSLRAALPNARIFLGNIPNVASIPFFTTIGPKIGQDLPPGYYLRYQRHGNSGPAFDSTNFSEANPPLITLLGGTYALYLGQPGGKWYADHHYPGLPPGIDTTRPFGLHPQNPWPDARVLDSGELQTAEAAITAFNTSIAGVAASHNAYVVDINGLLNDIKAHGYSIAGRTFTCDYISGGLFSLDGVHPSSRGNGVMANRFIQAMNAQLGTSIPLVDLGTLPGIEAPLGKLEEYRGIPILPPDAFQDLKMLWGGGR